MPESYRVLIGVLLGTMVTFAPAFAVAPPANEPPADHLIQLEKCRAGIMDPQARPDGRRLWAEMLFSFNSPQATELIVELLGLSDKPEVQRAFCAVIADRARTSSQPLTAKLVEPLIELLGAESDELRKLAALALTEFPGADVVAKLGRLADQADAPLAQRLAAIDALAPNTQRRDVVSQLVSLLDQVVPEIAERAMDALASATPEAFGRDADRWRRWWAKTSRLREEVWLAERLRVDRDRLRQVAAEFQSFRDHATRERSALTVRIGSFQRELFRAWNAERRESKLIEWLGDSLPVVQQTALTIIKARIADEGKRPEAEVQTVLLRLLEEGPAAIRRDVLEIVQNLNDATVVEAVLTRLEHEEDRATRHAIFKALGKLDSPAAIPALISEIADPDSAPACVREAAIALGSVASASKPTDHSRSAVQALKTRHNTVTEGQSALRAALLDAMAGVADAAFTPEFVDAVDSDDPAVLRPAIRGLRALGDSSRLPRLRSLTAHADLMVRLAAIDAVGQLGEEEADLESLLSRLNPTIESDLLAVEAAWRGFLEFLGRRTMEEQIQAAGRLRDLPEFEIKYLERLADLLPNVNGREEDLETVYDRMATVLVDRGRYAEAIEPLRMLHQALAARSDPAAVDCALRLLGVALRGSEGAEVASLVGQLAGDSDETLKAGIVQTVAEYLDSLDFNKGDERTRRLLVELRLVPPESVGVGWSRMLERLANRLDSDQTAGSTNSP